MQSHLPVATNFTKMFRHVEVTLKPQTPRHHVHSESIFVFPGSLATSLSTGSVKSGKRAWADRRMWPHLASDTGPTWTATVTDCLQRQQSPEMHTHREQKVQPLDSGQLAGGLAGKEQTPPGGSDSIAWDRNPDPENDTWPLREGENWVGYAGPSPMPQAPYLGPR